MQIPDNPFEINRLYQQFLDEIADNSYRSKKKEDLLFMKAIFVAYNECNKCTHASPYMAMVDAEFASRESAFTNRVILWSAVVAAVFAVIAAVPILQQWFQAFRHGGKDSNSQSPQSNSTPQKLSPPQESPFDTNNNH